MIRTKWRSLALAGVIAVLVTACSSGSTSSTAPSAAPSTAATVAPTEAASAASTAPSAQADCSSGQPINIGVIDSFSGFAAAYGKYAVDGINLALKDLGSCVDGRPIKLNQQDEACSPDGGVNAANKLVGQVIAVIGPECSGATLAANPILTKAQIPHFAQGFLGDITSQGDEWVFREAASDPIQMKVLADYMKAEGISKVAIANDTTAFASGEAAAFVKAWKANGQPDPVVTVTFDTTATDFSGQVQKVASANIDAIVICAYENPTAGFMKQAKQLGVTQPFFGGLVMADDIFSEAAGNAAEGATFVVNALDADAAQKPFNDKFQAVYGYNPGSLVVSYLGVSALLDALNRVGPDASPTTLRDAIRATNVQTPLGQASWNPQGDLIKPVVYIGKYQNGQRVSIQRLVIDNP